MKRHVHSALILLFVILAVGALPAQQTQNVTLGAGYANCAYVKLGEGVVASNPVAAWDIAFETAGYTASIIANGGAGIVVYNVPGLGPDNWESVDTTGLALDWTAWYDSDKTWHSGAFNMGADPNTGNFGWGEYNMQTHIVSGTTIYIVVLPDGAVLKFMVETLSGGVYSFRYAKLDGSDERTVDIKKADHAGRNFAYYSLQQHSEVEVEPATDSWDLVMGKYIAFVGESLDIPYGVTGVRTNNGVLCAEAADVDVATVNPNDYTLEEDITIIGHDWKIYDFTEGWLLRERLAYFVQSGAGDLYKLVFTDFGGSTTGTIEYRAEKLATTSVGEKGSPASAQFGTWPHPVSRGEAFRLVYSLGEELPTGLKLEIRNLLGAVVYTRTLEAAAGLNTLVIDDARLQSGSYVLSLIADGVAAHSTLICN